MRITRMAFGHSTRMTLAIVATVLAAHVADLSFPSLSVDAVDHAHGLLATGEQSHRGEPMRICSSPQWSLLAASVFRGACTMLQNYQGEAVGHAIAYEMKLAFYREAPASVLQLPRPCAHR